MYRDVILYIHREMDMTLNYEELRKEFSKKQQELRASDRKRLEAATKEVKQRVEETNKILYSVKYGSRIK